MKILLKRNCFDDNEVAINLADRMAAARTVEFMGRLPDELKNVQDSYEGLQQITDYLKNHHDEIIRVNFGYGDIYFMYKYRLHPKTVPSFRIDDVDETRPWLIDSKYGFEQIAYLAQYPYNQYKIHYKIDEQTGRNRS